MAEIIAKIGLDHARFDRGLSEASRGWEAWAQKVRRTPVELVPAKSARDSARVFEEIERARAEHIGNLNRDRLERALGTGAGAIGNLSGKSAAASASVFDALLPPLPMVERRANGILALLRRKFSATDIFKDAFRSLGVGLGVGGIASIVTEQFQTAADRAKALASHTNDLYQTTLRLIGVAGGPTRQLELQSRQVQELNRDIEDQRRLLASFSVMDRVRNPGIILEQEQVLDGLIQKQADLAAGIDIIRIEDERRTRAIQRQQVHANNLANLEQKNASEKEKFAARRAALEEEYAELLRNGAMPSAIAESLFRQNQLDNEEALFKKTQKEQREDIIRTAQLNAELGAAELRDAGELEKKQIQLNALRREADVIARRRGPDSNEAISNEFARDALWRDIALGQQKGERDLQAGRVELGQSLATGRAVAPRRGGRSERERIADRGESYRMRAEDAVRTGAGPEYVAQLTKMANRDFAKAGKAAERSLKQIDKADPAVGQLIRIHKALEEIKKNLEPKDTDE